MKKVFCTKIFAVLCAAPILAVACQREMPVSDEAENLIVRIADVTGQTKTSYDVNGKFSWNTGDKVAVHYEDGYVAMEVYTSSDNPAIGTLLSSSVETNVRDFYAVYPSSAAVERGTGETLPKVTLPAEYDLTALDLDEEGLKEYCPAVMVAKNIPGEDLYFYHVGGILQITLAEVDPATAKVVVTFPTDVTGDYAVAYTSEDTPMPYIETQGNTTSNTVSFTVDAAVIGDDNELVMNVPLPCGTYNSVGIKSYNSSGELLDERSYSSPLVCARHHGKHLPFYKSVQLYISDLVDGPIELTSAGGIIKLAEDFVSYSQKGSDLTPVEFQAEFSTDGVNWSTEVPEWLSISGTVDFTGSIPSAAQEIGATVDPQTNTVETNDYGIPLDEHTNTLRETGPVTDVDLSLINVATGATVSRTTANCYVVQAYGTYKFPVVYGNAIKGGNDNPTAYRAWDPNNNDYRPQAGQPYKRDGNYYYDACFIGSFKNHLGDYITTPYIAGQLSSAGGISSAKLLWMDADGLISNVAYEAGSTSDYTDDYVTFEVPQEGICQGNAVIAVFDADGKIAWSWHIWVTDEDLTKQVDISNGYGADLAPVNLGWVDMRLLEHQEEHKCYVRMAQTCEGGLTSNAVLITSSVDEDVVRAGNNPLYSIGRKDPIAGCDGEVGLYGNKVCYPHESVNPYYPKFGVPKKVDIATAIQNPHIQYVNDNVSGWSTPTYGNLWNSNARNNANDTDVFKTVYDPSPVGYRIPELDHFSDAKMSADKLTEYRVIDNLEYLVYAGVAFPESGLRRVVMSDYNEHRVHIPTSTCTFYLPEGVFKNHVRRFEYTPSSNTFSVTRHVYEHVQAWSIRCCLED